MASKKNRKPGAQPKSAGPAPKKRFRIEKLEERIAPKAHFNPQSKLVGDGNGGGGGGGGETSSGGTSSLVSVY